MASSQALPPPRLDVGSVEDSQTRCDLQAGSGGCGGCGGGGSPPGVEAGVLIERGLGE